MTREAYYDHRAPEYDDFWEHRRRYAGSPAEWVEERDAAFAVIATLAPKRTLDVACGTGFITRLLPGEVTALDQSGQMLELAAQRVPRATLVLGSGLALPFRDGAFERVFTSHFYGHLEPTERRRFLGEARRVAPELIVFDAALHDGDERDEWQERVLTDGSRWSVYKRFFSAASLASELGGSCDTLHAGRWFVIVRSVPDYGP